MFRNWPEQIGRLMTNSRLGAFSGSSCQHCFIFDLLSQKKQGFCKKTTQQNNSDLIIRADPDFLLIKKF